MDQKTTREQAIAEIHGDFEYKDILKGFTRVEKDKAQPVRDNPKWAEQYIEARLRGSL